MKKINSIHFGGKFIWLMVIFMVIIPGSLWLFNYFFENPIISRIIVVSIIMGALLGLLFLIVLSVELNQDKRLNKKYEKMKGCKISLDNNRFECANCGNTHVKAYDKACRVCGQIFNGTAK